MDARTFIAFLAGGLVMLALGRGVTRSGDADQAGISPFGLVIQAAGLGLLTFAIWRLIKTTF